MQRYPRCAATIASPAPVLPDVGSTIVPPGCKRPSRSAASIIAIAARSFTLPPGFTVSTLARSRPGTSSASEMRLSRASGVLPTRSRIDSAYCTLRRYPAISLPDRGMIDRDFGLHDLAVGELPVGPPPVQCRRGLHARAGRDVLARARYRHRTVRQIGEHAAERGRPRPPPDQHEPAAGLDPR